MKPTDFILEQHFKAAASRPQAKGEETITSFDRDIFWYDRDEVARQEENTKRADFQSTNYEDHRKVIETAVNFMRKTTEHEIAMAILTHRHFTDYRTKTFTGKGSFNTDYAFILKKINAIYNTNEARVKSSSIANKLKEFKEPTLVQLNHIAGIVTPVKVPDTGDTMNEWAIKLSAGAPESTSYMVAGLKVG